MYCILCTSMDFFDILVAVIRFFTEVATLIVSLCCHVLLKFLFKGICRPSVIEKKPLLLRLFVFQICTVCND